MKDGSYRQCKLQLSEVVVGSARYFLGMVIGTTRRRRRTSLEELLLGE